MSIMRSRFQKKMTDSMADKNVLEKPNNNQSWVNTFDKAKNLHQSGVCGDKDSVLEAYRLLDEVRGLAPEDNLVTAYYGSVLCLLGRDITESNKRFEMVLRGLKILDQAFKNDPDNFEIRIIRGNIGVNLPEAYFHQNATAVEDFNYLVSYYEQNPDFFPAELYFQFLYNLGSAYQNLDHRKQAESTWRKLITLAQNPQYAELLKERGFNRETEMIFTLTQSVSDILAEADKLHQHALMGEPKELKLALDFLAKALVLHPNHQLLKAYQADCISFSAKDASNTGEMFASAIKATKILDDIINNDPNCIKLRLLRANHSLRLPELFFSRTATAIVDLEYLVEQHRQASAIFTQEQYWEILYKLGLSYQRLGMITEAEQIWQNLLQVKIDPQISAEIEKQLHNMLPPTETALSITKNRQDFYQEAKRLHDLGVSGNKFASQMALKLWQEAYATEPEDSFAQAYYGSSLALTVRDAIDTNVIFSKAIQGMKHLTEAVNRDPENWEIRLLRAYLAYSLPEAFFHTTNQAVEDFSYLSNAYEQNNNLFPKEIYRQVVDDLAKARQRNDQNLKVQEVLADCNNS